MNRPGETEGTTHAFLTIKEERDALASRVAELEMECDDARHMLRRLEWSVDICGLRGCPACSGKQPGQLGMRSLGGHTFDCSMATALGIPMDKRIGMLRARPVEGVPS